MDYCLFVAHGLDRGWKNTTILRKLIELHNNKEINIPTKAFVYIDRYRLLCNDPHPPLSITQIENEINRHEYPFFIDEAASKSTFRQIFKNKALEAKKQIEKIQLQQTEQGYKRPVIRKANYREAKAWDRTMGNDLGLFHPKSEKWQEAQFQHLYSFIERNQMANPGYSELRLYANHFIDTEGKLQNKQKIPWKWLISHNGVLASHVGLRALELCLDRQVQDTISSKEVKLIETISRWFCNEPKLKRLWLIDIIISHETGKTKSQRLQAWIGALLGGEGSIKWDRLESAVRFIRHNITRPPDFELLKDWLNGEVDIDGIGKIQREMANKYKNEK